ncbi:hypothetical protein [Kitasatospora aureofaciens]|uniref:hypothetical protein n=1 Tax=Kitasatospora aureofaciens TaxID=1894 RepID=UPI003F4B4921
MAEGHRLRTVADVSAVADPATGVAVYQTYGGSGWNVYDGTSAVRAPRFAVRRDQRRQRQLLTFLPVHRRYRLRRPDRTPVQQHADRTKAG